MHRRQPVSARPKLTNNIGAVLPVEIFAAYIRENAETKLRTTSVCMHSPLLISFDTCHLSISSSAIAIPFATIFFPRDEIRIAEPDARYLMQYKA